MYDFENSGVACPPRGRLCPTYSSVSRLPLASATYAHALDADWPLCTFEARGACRDAQCQFQMARDYALGAAGVLRSLHALARRCARSLHCLPGSACWAVAPTFWGRHEQRCPSIVKLCALMPPIHADAHECCVMP